MKINRPIIILVFAVMLSAAACAIGTQVVSTPSLTAAASATSEALATPTEIPQPTPTYDPAQEVIHIQMPGPLSEVISPVLVEGFSGPTFEQNLVVLVSNLDGTVLALEPATIQADIGEPGPYSVTLEFAVEETQPGRISVYDIDARDGGLVHLASVPVSLLASGEPAITMGDAINESIRIDAPGFLAEVQGGEVVVTGVSGYYFEGILSVALCGNHEGGGIDLVCGTIENVLAVGNAFIDSSDIGLPGSFSGTVNYTVQEPTPGRLVVYAQSPMDGRIEHLGSVAIMLLP